METIPLLSEDLISELDKHYPPLSPDTIMQNDEKKLAFLAGQRKVVEFLKMVLERQQQEDLDIDV